MDLMGMGKSDKPDIEYRFFDRAKYVEGFIHGLGLRDLTLVVRDWGSALGFHYATRNESNIRGIAFMEALLWSGNDFSLRICRNQRARHVHGLQDSRSWMELDNRAERFHRASDARSNHQESSLRRS